MASGKNEFLSQVLLNYMSIATEKFAAAGTAAKTFAASSVASISLYQADSVVVREDYSGSSIVSLVHRGSSTTS